MLENRDRGGDMPYVPISWGELIDKITILEIKSARLSSPPALANVRKELAVLRQIAERHPGTTPSLADLAAELKRVNEELWQIEEDIREKEEAGSFGEGFIALARSVYKTNDRRAELKRQINLHLNSALFEEKSYETLRRSAGMATSS